MTATIQDIAKKTGLGVATVSAYLNGVRVRSKNKELIEAAIQELGYVRNDYARGLKTRRSMTIGVLIPEFSNLFSTTIVSEMENLLREKGYGIIVCDCKSDAEMEKESLRFLLSKMVDGLIVMPTGEDGAQFAAALDREIPVVVLDRLTQNEKVSHVTIDNRAVAQKATQILTANGHRHIAIITGDERVYTARERDAGYKEALTAAHCYKKEYVYDGGLTVEGGYLAMKQIIETHAAVTAVFATNYEMSIGAIIAINEHGRHIPEDYSFVGFDNMALAKVFSPKLVTVNQPLEEIGRKAAELLIAGMEGNAAEHIVLKAEIAAGGSVRNIAGTEE